MDTIIVHYSRLFLSHARSLILRTTDTVDRPHPSHDLPNLKDSSSSPSRSCELLLHFLLLVVDYCTVRQSVGALELKV
jgi:hypothetical protein